jgi:hypothetical protein
VIEEYYRAETVLPKIVAAIFGKDMKNSRCRQRRARHDGSNPASILASAISGQVAIAIAARDRLSLISRGAIE